MSRRSSRYQLWVVAVVLALVAVAGVLLDVGQSTASFALLLADLVAAPFALLWTIVVALRREHRARGDG